MRACLQGLKSEWLVVVSAVGVAVEPLHVCPPAGGGCVNLVECGDGRVTGNEKCDDGNAISDDGCSADCLRIEDGFLCLAPSAQCVEVAVCDTANAPLAVCSAHAVVTESNKLPSNVMTATSHQGTAAARPARPKAVAP